VAGAVGFAYAASLAWAAPGGLANPGRIAASVPACASASQARCGGSLEINGELYRFASGSLKGHVNVHGVLSATTVSFGAAHTDPETQGPYQLALQVVALGDLSGGWESSGAATGVSNRYGLYFGFGVPIYITLSGSGVPAGCSIGSASEPLTADFDPTLASLFSSAGVPYDQQTGIADLTAVIQSLPGAAGCGSASAGLDEQLGLPGGGSVAVVLKFKPPIVSAAYRALHHGQRHHRRKRRRRR